ncbi:MAG: aminoacyl-histidine dipeptidase [Bacteroidales bacterium]|jgi:dipeptidase D|nr:aminoacyl-histidine dipeptidase [Bacteroidales bacterium]MBO5978857.1 aminoacyl-histidine dipeptidase [Bacteroidales bacterium]
MTSETVLSFFKEITAIPRESGHEEQIVAYLQKFAADNGLECKTDEAGNVLIVKEAAPGYENVPTIVLQSHSDMVCEKNEGVEHDFAKDPIKYIIKDGWMIAPDTTLGADCGIGVAAQMAVLVSDIPCGKIECLFTTAEETGLDGAMALSPDFITGKVLLNLDSEDEGEIFVGCAGGLDTTAEFHYKEEPVQEDFEFQEIFVKDAMGGHSGDDINKGRANAVQLLGRFLYSIIDLDWQLITINGGNKRNAIAREAKALIAAEPDTLDIINERLEAYAEDVAEEYGAIEKELKVGYAEYEGECTTAIDEMTAWNLVTALCASPHGVLAMSQEIENFVETSTNLASVKMTEPGVIRIGSSQRSCVTAARRAAAAKMEACFVLAGAIVKHEGEYPGWAPAAESPVRDACVASYKKLFGTEPKVKAIHAGLECGLFTEKFPGIDMVSFGPTLRGVHAPGERLDLASLDKFVALLVDVIRNYK